MSYSASTMGLPVLRHSSSASMGASARSFSAMRKRMRPRSWAVVWGQPPSSNARRAATTAWSRSAAEALGTSARASSVEGSRTWIHSPEVPLDTWPSMYIGTCSALVMLDMRKSPSVRTLRCLDDGFVGNRCRTAGCTLGHPQRPAVEEIGRAEDQGATDDQLGFIEPDGVDLARRDEGDDHADGGGGQSGGG